MVQLRVLVTGATGFVGRYLCDDLRRHDYQVTGAVRRKTGGEGESSAPDIILGPELAADSDWSSLLKGQDLVVHAAARVHVMHETSADPLAAFRAVNVAGTLALARQAAAAGVKRFVFLSSIKVNGEITLPGVPFTEKLVGPPTDPYGLSKFEAEQALLALAAECKMEVVIVRPPLIYGPGVKANFARMIRWVRAGIPLPLAAVDNRRSLVGLGNLSDFIRCVLTHPVAANQVFLVSDGQDLSTTELLRQIGGVVGVPARLFAVPAFMLRWAMRCPVLGSQMQRLCGSLQLDTGKAARLLQWSAPFSLHSGLQQTVGQSPEDTSS
nr:NAD-dependent epimerase/dehydratase family protein [uncultured Tolumonas sp.]